MAPFLEIGITTWNSAAFIEVALTAIGRVCGDWQPRVLIWDNGSTDDTVAIASKFGATVHVEPLSQPDALNRLAAAATAKRVLLMHADVVLLDTEAFAMCLDRLDAGAALVSPEDIGCGPWTWPFGRGMPESSFMLFRGDALTRLRRWTLGTRRYGIRWPRRLIDFYGPHVTHRLPAALVAAGLHWHALKVHPSPSEALPWYAPSWQPPVWREDLGKLRYGLGNFYSIDGRISHYHNWYERALRPCPPDSRETTGRSGEGFPLAYVSAATRRFVDDWRTGRLQLPTDLASFSEPCAL